MSERHAIRHGKSTGEGVAAREGEGVGPHEIAEKWPNASRSVTEICVSSRRPAFERRAQAQ